MLTVSQAIRAVLKEVPPKRITKIHISNSLGCVLAEDVASDINMPPFDKSAMDGYAVIASNVSKPPVTLKIIAEIPAGKFSSKRLKNGEAAKIMTGAPLPKGADAVVMVEKTESVAKDRVKILDSAKRGQHICFKGEDLKNSKVIFRKGKLIRAQEIATLASVGKAEIKVYKKPSIAILTTGDELVDITKRPPQGKIRNSNNYCIAAQVRAMGLECEDLGIARDKRDKIRRKIREGLKKDVLIISGGVSVGEYDFVKESLDKEAVNMVLHKVSIKPGKPFYFGKTGNKRVFALPGNPASGFVIFEVFVKPFLKVSQGYKFRDHKIIYAKIETQYRKSADRTLYIPAKLEYAREGFSVEAVPWHGAADIFALTNANSFIIIDANSNGYDKGDLAKVMPIE